MAERRMFAKTIVLSDPFLDMPLTARCLYFTLGMLADDDGFVNAPKSIMRQCGASEDDMKVLLSKKFLLSFESGVIVIKHWRINNYLRNDRYVETKYKNEKSTLILDENGAYSSGGIPNIGKPSIGKVRLGKDSIESNTPTLEEVVEYIQEKQLNIVGQEFFDYYEARNWITAKGVPVNNWKCLCNTWAKREKAFDKKSNFNNYEGRPKKSEDYYNSLLTNRRNDDN